jgi:hypothetical protein
MMPSTTPRLFGAGFLFFFFFLRAGRALKPWPGVSSLAAKPVDPNRNVIEQAGQRIFSPSLLPSAEIRV